MATYITCLPKELQNELNRYLYMRNTCVIKELFTLFKGQISLTKCLPLINKAFTKFNLKTKLYFDNDIKYELNDNDIFTDDCIIEFITKYLEACMIIYENYPRKRKSCFEEFRIYYYNGIRFDIQAEQDKYFMDIYRIIINMKS